MKFKVGDRVRVKEGLENGRLYGDLAFISEMNGCRGEVFEVCSIDEDEKYRLKGAPCFYNDEMLEPAPFGKSDLKTGMQVRTKDGVLYMILENINTKNYGKQEFILANFDGGFTCGDNYDDDLRHSNDSEYDIEEVYSVPASGVILKPVHCAAPIWKREEAPVEVTIAEIAELKGVSPERIRIKED